MCAANSIDAVSVMKIPPFWPADPTLWFAQLDAQFKQRNITQQQTKFSHVVSSLSPEIATEVRDLILSPPAENPFEALKNALIERTSETEQERLHKLLTSECMGDKKPTQFLRRMQQLAGNNDIQKSLFRELFLQRLPPVVKIPLAALGDVDVEILATTADRILEVASATDAQQINIVQSCANQNTTNVEATTTPQWNEMQHRLRRLEDSINQLTLSTNNNRSPIQSSRPKFSGDEELCWYHAKFGAKAKKCNGGNCNFNRQTKNVNTQA